MIKSMTGFGKYQWEYENKLIHIEIKSINSKQLDLTCRIPSLYRELESEIRTRIANTLLRGKIECIVQVNHKTEDNNSVNLRLNKDQLRQYYKEIKELTSEIEYKGDIDHIFPSLLSLPNIIIEKESAEIEDTEKQKIIELLSLALQQIDESRSIEGEVLKQDFLRRITLIENSSKLVENFEKQRVDSTRERIKKQLDSLGMPDKIDENRLEQEMIYYLEKLDITEEKVRLNKHCLYFRQTLEEEAAGKKLAFITQEIGREINTMGSKANEVNIQKIVVQMKDELEKIKEQLFNIL
ncbi:MAG: YicC/YloC family endoribonuclease [Bacteroidales bacterium]